MTYSIYQLPQLYSYSFMPFERAKESGFNIDHYTCVYHGSEIVYEDGSECDNPKEVLEYLFTKFNIDTPEDFHGHLLSTSDIVELIYDNKDEFYYCEPFGWEDVTTFCQF